MTAERVWTSKQPVAEHTPQTGTCRMKKQAKSKRPPPRRKPIRKPIPQKSSQGGFHLTQELREVEAEQRAMRESMPPGVLEEYFRIMKIDDDDLSEEDDARIEKIFDEYMRVPPQDVMARHLADIAREREQKTAQDQQDGTVT